MKILGKIWSGITWAAGKVWDGIKWVGGKIWGAAKSAVGWVRKQPAWKVALIGAAGVAAVLIASKLGGGGNDMDLYGRNGGNGIATAAKVVGGAVAIGAGAELAYRGVSGVLGKNQSSSGSPNPGSSPTPVTTGTPGSAPTVVTTGTPTGKAPTSPATYTLPGEANSTAADIEPVSDLDLDISSDEINELEAELDAFEASKDANPNLGFAQSMSKVGAGN